MDAVTKQPLPFSPNVRLSLTASRLFFTPDTAALLEQILLTGSTQAACSQVGLSYSKGRSLLRTLEQELGYTVVHRQKGGPGGGTSCLTPAGERLLNAYRQLEARVCACASEEFSPLLTALRDVPRTVWLIRHGQSAGSARRCIGRTDLPLDAVGRTQARRLALWSADKQLTAVFTSPLIRCTETAQLLSDGRLPVQEEADLREMDAGEWDGLSFAEICARWPEVYAARGKHLGTVPPPGGESFRQAGARLGACMNALMARSRGNIAVVTHAGAARGWLYALLDRDPDEVLSLPQPWGGITKLTYCSGSWSVQSIGLRPESLPSPLEIRLLLDRFDVSPAVRAHGEAVARAALSLADQPLAPKVDRPLLESACLLHDLARGNHDHAALGAQRLTEFGFPRLAPLIAVHHDLPEDACPEAQLLYLADKLVCGTQPVPLDTRFAASRERCRDSAALAAWQRRYDAAKTILDRYSLKWSC